MYNYIIKLNFSICILFDMADEVYKNKYIKYKNKYIQLKNQLAGAPTCKFNSRSLLECDFSSCADNKSYAYLFGICIDNEIREIQQQISNNVDRFKYIMQYTTIDNQTGFDDDVEGYMNISNNILYSIKYFTDFTNIIFGTTICTNDTNNVQNEYDKYNHYRNKLLENISTTEFNENVNIINTLFTNIYNSIYGLYNNMLDIMPAQTEELYKKLCDLSTFENNLCKRNENEKNDSKYNNIISTTIIKNTTDINKEGKEYLLLYIDYIIRMIFDIMSDYYLLRLLSIGKYILGSFKFKSKSSDISVTHEQKDNFINTINQLHMYEDNESKGIKYIFNYDNESKEKTEINKQYIIDSYKNPKNRINKFEQLVINDKKRKHICVLTKYIYEIEIKLYTSIQHLLEHEKIITEFNKAFELCKNAKQQFGNIKEQYDITKTPSTTIEYFNITDTQIIEMKVKYKIFKKKCIDTKEQTALSSKFDNLFKEDDIEKGDKETEEDSVDIEEEEDNVDTEEDDNVSELSWSTNGSEYSSEENISFGFGDENNGDENSSNNNKFGGALPNPIDSYNINIYNEFINNINNKYNKEIISLYKNIFSIQHQITNINGSLQQFNVDIKNKINEIISNTNTINNDNFEHNIHTITDIKNNYNKNMKLYKKYSRTRKNIEKHLNKSLEKMKDLHKFLIIYGTYKLIYYRNVHINFDNLIQNSIFDEINNLLITYDKQNISSFDNIISKKQYPILYNIVNEELGELQKNNKITIRRKYLKNNIEPFMKSNERYTYMSCLNNIITLNKQIPIIIEENLDNITSISLDSAIVKKITTELSKKKSISNLSVEISLIKDALLIKDEQSKKELKVQLQNKNTIINKSSEKWIITTKSSDKLESIKFNMLNIFEKTNLSENINNKLQEINTIQQKLKKDIETIDETILINERNSLIFKQDEKTHYFLYIRDNFIKNIDSFMNKYINDENKMIKFLHEYMRIYRHTVQDIEKMKILKLEEMNETEMNKLISTKT